MSESIETLAQKAHDWSVSNSTSPTQAFEIFRVASGLLEAADERARAEAAEAEVERLTRECLDREATETDARERLRRCEERLRQIEAGADPTPRDEAAWPTRGQAWHELLEAPAVHRLHRLGRLIDLAIRTESLERELERHKEAAGD